MIPDLRKLLSVKLTQAERKERDKKMKAQKEEEEEDTPDQLLLIAQVEPPAGNSACFRVRN